MKKHILIGVLWLALPAFSAMAADYLVEQSAKEGQLNVVTSAKDQLAIVSSVPLPARGTR
ncbi:hypothetical protein LZT28_04035 [Aeromonas media]|uniref:Uncharacterized protein n=1 Tax=Aeromonas media TaxID=651 RepID=A0AAW5RFC1_AERME|nr:hypothetical protein [Aeromonas media]MCV3287430.1 hypothetical protein [Aeromonas media]